MHNTRLLHLFHHFDVWERKHLRQFLNSPFFNRREDVCVLFDHLDREKGKSNPDFSKQNAFAKVFHSETYDEQKMHLLSSYLSKLIEQFIAFREISKDKSTTQLHLAQAFRKVKMEADFERALTQGKKILEKQPRRDGNYLRQFYDLELERYNFIGSRSRSTENNLQELSDAFDRLYIAEKLRQFCLQVSHQNVFKKDYSSAMHRAIFSMLEDSPEYLEHPAIGVYYFCHQAITTGEEEHFQKLRALMEVHAERFTNAELRDIHLLAINYCIKRMNTGRESYIRQGFELYRAGFANGYFLENNEVSHFTFINVVALALKLEQYKWAEKFIEEHRYHLPHKFRQSVYQYSLARVRYEQKRYKEAMKLLILVDSSDHLMNLGAKLTLLKIYYELDEYEALFSLLESMRLYLQRKEVISYHREYYSKIIRLTKKMVGHTGRKKEKEKLREKANELRVANVREWFLEQIDK